MTQDNMKPCPFCGSANIDPSFVRGYKAGDMTQPIVAAGCNECGGTGPDVLATDHSTGYEEATQKWNSRQQADQKELAGDFQVTRLISAHALIKEGRADEALPMIERAIKCAREQAGGESEPVPNERGKNRYGLDMAYFRNLINRELNRPLVDFRPDELARVFARASRTADSSVMSEPEFSHPVGYAGGGEAVELSAIKAAYSIVKSACENAAPVDRVFLASHQKLLGNLVAEIESRPAPAVPDAMPMDPFQTIDIGSKNYKAGWNACRQAMLASKEGK